MSSGTQTGTQGTQTTTTTQPASLTTWAYVTHIISIIALAGTVTGLTAIAFIYFKMDDITFLWMSFTWIAYGVGMSYYLTTVQVNAQGLQQTTTSPAA